MKTQGAILGNGNIGTDLLIKAMRSPHLECTLFAPESVVPGMTDSHTLGVGSPRTASRDRRESVRFDSSSSTSAIAHLRTRRDSGGTRQVVVI